MPRLPIDYTKAVIYKIVYRDVSVTEKYVGSTTDLRNRRSTHKHSSTNPKSKDYNVFVYQFIRDHGGFENWDVVLVENVVGCTYSAMLHARERYWFETLHAELNKQIPARSNKEWQKDNRDKLADFNKKYCELNKDKCTEYKRQYKILNRVMINEKQRERRALKKAKILNQVVKL
jgi:predicted GIY-YIG superfamily endonuclease